MLVWDAWVSNRRALSPGKADRQEAGWPHGGGFEGLIAPEEELEELPYCTRREIDQRKVVCNLSGP